MFKKLRLWYNSKKGKDTLIGVLSAALLLSLLGQFGLFEGLGGLLSGTAGPGEGEYSCMPTCTETDGKFLSMPGDNMASFGGAQIDMWITAAQSQPAFELGIFDGDSGLDNTGALNMPGGNWDTTTTECVYTLYADPGKDGPPSDPATEVVVAQWLGNTNAMPNNAWFAQTVNNNAAALSGDGKAYHYRLTVARDPLGSGISAFKLRVKSAIISSGRSDLVDSNFAIVGMLGTLQDRNIIYPAYVDKNNMGPTTYDGTWEFYFDVPSGAKTISFWDGDFDRGPDAVSVERDTNDPNTVGIPEWADPAVTNPQGEAGQGSPADDFGGVVFRRSPAVIYKIIGPNNDPIFTNDNPSGTEEWEEYVVSTDAALNPDLLVSDIKPGSYKLLVEGLDVFNTVWFRINYDITDQPPEDCPVCPVCPDIPPQPTVEPTPPPTLEPTPPPTPEPTPPPGEPEVCQAAVPVDVLYVLDISGSMDELYPSASGQMGTKLDAAKDAIMALNTWVQAQGNGSRVALTTFNAQTMRSDKNRREPNIQLVSGFTDNINGFNAQLLGLKANGWTPTSFALDNVTQWLPGQLQAGRNALVILISDGVPTIDYDKLVFDGGKVGKVNVYDANNVALAIDVVRASGAVEKSHGQTAGEPVADVMVAINSLKTAMPGVPVSAIAIQAAPGEGVFNDQVLRYVAERGAGDFFMTNNPEDLQSALKWVFVTTACGGETPPPANPPETPPPPATTCTNYVLTAQDKSDTKRARLEIKNNDAANMQVARIRIESWPTQWGKLDRIRFFGGDWINVNGSAPVDLTVNVALGAGQQKNIIAQFANNVSNDVSGWTGYVEMQNGCRVNFGTAQPPAPTPLPPSCPNPRTNQYRVENTTNNPFYGIKFEYQSGTEIRDGNYDEFAYVLNATNAAAMTSMQVEAKAGTRVGTATISGCSFTQSTACAVVQDQNGYFKFQFLGATDNGNGTLTLRFKVQVVTNRALSHATFGLPTGVKPSSPTTNYQSRVCP